MKKFPFSLVAKIKSPAISFPFFGGCQIAWPRRTVQPGDDKFIGDNEVGVLQLTQTIAANAKKAMAGKMVLKLFRGAGRIRSVEFFAARAAQRKCEAISASVFGF